MVWLVGSRQVHGTLDPTHKGCPGFLGWPGKKEVLGNNKHQPPTSQDTVTKRRKFSQEISHADHIRSWKTQLQLTYKAHSLFTKLQTQSPDSLLFSVASLGFRNKTLGRTDLAGQIQCCQNANGTIQPLPLVIIMLPSIQKGSNRAQLYKKGPGVQLGWLMYKS